ncbi:MAG: metallophosphoesterase [Alcanivorax sp.]|nr:metallophosphoesterase [Alcanivorax sp.]
MNTITTFFRNGLPLAAALALVACGGGGSGASPAASTANSETANQPSLPEESPVTAPASLAKISFVVIGDSGEGSEGQYAVGKAIASVCNAKGGMAGAMDHSQARPGCDLVVGLGDNIYEAGVTSVDDPQFAEKFETPFEPVKLPFYMVLGNHDNTGYVAGDGADNSRGEFEVDYTFFDGRLSNRWHMPNRYYKQSEGLTRNGRPLVDFFGLDSNPIAGGFADPDLAYAYHTYGLAERNWTVDAMAGSNAVFRIGMAHHPYLSNGDHGNAGSYDGVPSEILPVLAGTRWKDFMEEAVCDKADFLLAGHDHDMQVLDAVPSCGRTEFVVSGAASKSRSLKDPQRNTALFQQGDTFGFFWMQAVEADPATLTPARMCLEAYLVNPQEPGQGVIRDGKPTPAFRHCFDKQPMTGMTPSNAFSGQPMAGSGIATALPLPDGFDAAFAGPLQEFRQALVAGFNQAGSTLPGPQQPVFAELVTATDTLFNALDAATAAVLSGDSSDMTQSLQALLAASQQLDAIDTSTLPAPFDQLDDAFHALAQGFGNGNTGASGSTVDDVAFIAGPLVELSRNLNNILDGIDQQVPPDVPVLAGLTSVLSTVSLGLSNSLQQIVLLDSSATGEELVGTLAATLQEVSRDVLWLNQIPGAGDYATLPGDALSATLLTVVREVTQQLDDRLLSPLTPLLDLLSPLTDLLKALLANL